MLEQKKIYLMLAFIVIIYMTIIKNKRDEKTKLLHKFLLLSWHSFIKTAPQIRLIFCICMFLERSQSVM